MVGSEQVAADIGPGQSQAVGEILLDGVIVHNHAVEGVDIHADLALLPAAQHQVPVHVELVAGHVLQHLADEPLPAEHENVHGGQILLPRGVVHHHVADLALAVQLHGQIQQLLAVGHAGLGNHGQVLAALDVGIQNLGQVDVRKHGGVDHHHVPVISAELQKVYGAVQRLQLAPVGVAGGHGVGVRNSRPPSSSSRPHSSPSPMWLMRDW